MPTVQQIMAKPPRKKRPDEMQTLPGNPNELRKSRVVPLKEQLQMPVTNTLDNARNYVKEQIYKVKPYKKLLDALDTGGMKRKR